MLRLVRFVIIWAIVAALAGLVFVKLYQAKIEFDLIELDFSVLLSLTLAIFAVGLSVTFYMKASETANRFYDNTYQFTKDISETLGRLDERFAERLTFIGSSDGLFEPRRTRGVARKA
jgi:hypothetical protein